MFPFPLHLSRVTLQALQSSQPMQLGRHAKPSGADPSSPALDSKPAVTEGRALWRGEQLVGGTKRFVIVRNLTPDVVSSVCFQPPWVHGCS